MHGAIRRGLWATGVFGAAGLLFPVACANQTSESSAPQSSPGLSAKPATALAKPELGALLGKATVPLVAKGSGLVPVFEKSAQGVSPKLDMELPLAADGLVKLHPIAGAQHSLGLLPVLSSKVEAAIASDGSAVYQQAFGSADLVQSATLEGLRTEIAIRDASSPDFFAWKVELGNDLRAVPRDDLGTDLVDSKGDAWLSVSPVSIIDGKGKPSKAALYFASDGYARLQVPQNALAYPALVDFAVTLGNVQALAITPTQIKGRVMVLLDTSGSMLYHFTDNNGTGGDSTPGEAVFCDNSMGSGVTYACNANTACTAGATGRPYWPVADAANPSRMLASKLAIQNVVNANAGILDFGLERYAESETCTDPLYCCQTQIDGTTRGRCKGVGGYTDMPNSGTTNDLTYDGSCGTPYRGGRVLVTPQPSSGTQLLPWVDFTENFCSSTGVVGGAPRNPELRANGSTPLGRAVITGREDWYRPVFTDSRNATVEADDDPLIDCRPYVYVVMTDGDDTCSAGSTHVEDCNNTNSACVSNECFDTNTGTDNNGAITEWGCACKTNADCPGQDSTCKAAPALTQDCNGDNAQCGAGATCIDTPGAGDNWRCSCTVDGDCGPDMVCATGTTPEVDCRGDNTRCVSNKCYDAPGPGTNWRCACNGDAQCPASQHCDIPNNRCIADGVCTGRACQVAEPNPQVQVQRLTDINTTNPVKTYVLGMGDKAGLNTTILDAMAVAGGTKVARYASNQTEIEAAFADIVAQSVKYEKCNNQDDNCNNLYDEGLGVFQECVKDADCSGGLCSFGRCTCTSGAQCAAGFTCSAETPVHFCRPSCSEGQGACLVNGVRKCGVGVGQCCINDNSPTCNDIVPPTGTAEVCNGIDDNCNGFIDENLSCQGCVPLPEVCDGKDNDCDGKIDETGPGGLVDVGGPCGSSVGLCKPGTAVCTKGVLGCSGDMGPFAEVCNGYDDDCDGVTDGMTQACYTGAMGTEGVGTCHGGTQVCTAVANSGMANWGACTGETKPTKEVCNGLDDDCDGTVDNGIPSPVPGQATGDECCSDKATGGKCGVGQCTKGTWQCAGSVVVCANAGVPTNETCDNEDNDCDGMIDNIATVGGPCVAPGGCSGTLKCDSAQKQLVCAPSGMTALEVCNGLDDDCDGQTDEIDDVMKNDPWWGMACDAPPAGHDQPPCQAGKYVCKNGTKVCDGAVGPQPEICDLKDNDCDGMSDTLAACPGKNACVQGVCVEPCHGGEFPCPGGYECDSFNGSKYCVPTTCNAVECPPGASCKNGKCTLDNTGGTSSGGTSSGGSATMGGDNTGTGGDNTGTGGDNTGNVGQAGDNTGNTSGTAGTAGTDGSGATGATSATPPHGVYGIVTGGGGCACRTTPQRSGWLEAMAGLLLIGAAVSRRRRGGERRAS